MNDEPFFSETITNKNTLIELFHSWLYWWHKWDWVNLFTEAYLRFLCPTHLRASFIWTSFLFRLKLQYKVCDATNASKLERWSVTVSKRVVLFWCEVMPKWNPVLLMNRCNFSKYVWKKYGCGREMSDINDMKMEWFQLFGVRFHRT